MALHILLADDSVPAQNMGKKILTEAGYDVTTVGNGLEALRKIAETIPDLLILDIFMPGYSGLEVCQKMRASTATAALPVILTVGKLEPYRAEDGEQVHSNAIIVKPFAATELISAVRSLVGGPPEAAPLPVSDPLEHSKFAGPLAPAQHGEAEPEEPADEPLFTYGSSLGDEHESHPSANETATHQFDLPAQTAVEDAQSLVYNPDAAHTPFRASATDFPPSMPQSPAGNEESPLAELGLESSGSDYSNPAEQSAPEVLSAAAVSEAPETTEAAAPEVPFEFEPLTPEAPAPDPLLESPEESNMQQVGGASETPILDDFSRADAAPAEPLSPEEEARLKAFEDLFNSPDLPPLEQSPLVDEAMHMDILPSVSHTPDLMEMEVQPDPELELYGHDAPSAPLVSQSDPELLQEEDPRSAIGNIPDRDVMLDDVAEPSQGSSAIQELLPAFDEQFSAQPFTSFEIEGSAAPAVLPEVESGAYSGENLVLAEPVELTSESAAPVVEHPAETLAPEFETASVAPEAIPDQPAPAEMHSADSEPTEPAVEPTAVLAAPESEPAASVEPVVSVAEPTPETADVFFELEAQPALADTAQAPPEVEAQPIAAPTEPAAPPEPPSAPPEPEAEPTAAEKPAPETPVPEAETPAPKPPQSHSVISELAAFGSGVGVTAALPSLVHFLEAEVKHAFSHTAPALEEPHPAEAIAPAGLPTEPDEAPAPVVLSPAQHEAAEPAPTHPEVEAQSDAAAAESVMAAPHAPDHESAARSPEAERVHLAVEKVFDRFKPLLVAAIVRELARHD